MKMVRRTASLLLAAVVLVACFSSCRPAKPGEDDPSSNPVTPIPVGKRDSAVSLNGTWDLYVDTIEKTAEYKNEKGTGSIETPLPAGTIGGMKLKVSSLSEGMYAKVRAYVRIDAAAATAEGEVGHRLGVRINGGDWVYTDIRYYQNGTPHWVDLSMKTADLKEGENTVELRSTMANGVTLLGDKATGNGAAYMGKDDKTTANPQMNFCLRVKTATCGSKWQSATVPAAAEGQFSLSHAAVVRPNNYNGVVWYRRNVNIAQPEDGKDWWLCFDAVDYKAEVWLNGYFFGTHEGGYTAFEYNLSTLPDIVRTGGDNELVVRVIDQDWNNGLTDDDIHIKETLAGFTQDTRMLNYSGIWQNVYLEARGTVTANDVYVQTLDINTGAVEVQMTLKNPQNTARTVTVEAAVTDGPTASLTVEIPAGGEKAVTLPSMTIANPRLWNAQDPYRYTLTVQVKDGATVDTLVQKFGIRQVTTAGTKVVLNGEAIFLTGMLHWGSYYDNYTSAVSIEQARYEIEQLKQDGFNAIKYCLFTPPDYILDLCDEMGMYVYIEYPNWNPTESAVFFERAYLQMMEMVVKDRRFASVLMTDFNCEDLEFSAEMDQLMQWCVTQSKKLAPNRLYTDNSSNGEHKYGDFVTCHPYYQVNCYEDMLDGWIAAREEKPLFLGEFADISVLRDLAELKKQESEAYSWYHDYYKDYDQAAIMREYGYTEEEIDRVIEESVLNAQELRKYYLEASKSNPNVAGLFLTHIVESPNGWADGWFDDLNQKHFDSDYIRQAASETTLLFERDTLNYWAGQSYPVGAGLSLYGGADLTSGTITYTLSAGDKVVSDGAVKEGVTYKNGEYYRVGDFTLNFPAAAEAVCYKLTLTLTDGGKTLTTNSWNVWAYPKEVYTGADIAVYDPRNVSGLREKYPNAMTFKGSSSTAKIVVTTEMNSSLLAYVSNGGKVLYIGQGTGPIKAVNNWDYNRLSFAYSAKTENALVQSLKNLGYGGLQFLDLATQWHLEGADTAEGNLIGRYAITNGSIGSYLGEYSIGEGTLLQTTLRMNSQGFVLGGGLLTHESLSATSNENVLGAYLTDQMVRYLVSK